MPSIGDQIEQEREEREQQKKQRRANYKNLAKRLFGKGKDKKNIVQRAKNIGQSIKNFIGFAKKAGALIAKLFTPPILYVTLAVIVLILIFSLYGYINYNSNKIRGFFYGDILGMETYIIEELSYIIDNDSIITPKDVEKISDIYTINSEKLTKWNVFARILAGEALENFGEHDKVEAETYANLTPEEKQLLKQQMESELADVEDNVEVMNDFSISIDQYPFFVEMERQSYAWTYPDWNICDNEIEHKIYNMYKNLYEQKENNGTRLEKYIISDYMSEEKEKIYLFEKNAISEIELEEAYKKTFNKTDLIFVESSITLEKGLEVEPPTDATEKRKKLKKQLDMVYENLIKRYTDRFELTEACARNYGKEDRNKPLIYKLDKNNNIGKVYLYWSPLHKFLIKKQEIDLEYKRHLTEHVDDPYQGFRYEDLKDIVNNIINEEYGVKKNDDTPIVEGEIDLQEQEYDNRLPWYYIKTLLYHAALESDNPEANNSKLTGNWHIDTISKILAWSTPYFQYVYPEQNKADVENLFLDFEKYDENKFTFDETAKKYGYLDFNEDDKNNIRKGIKNNNNENFIRTLLKIKDIIKDNYDYIPQDVAIYKPYNHEIKYLTNEDAEKYYVKHKLNNKDAEGLYDEVTDTYTVKRYKEYAYTESFENELNKKVADYEALYNEVNYIPDGKRTVSISKGDLEEEEEKEISAVNVRDNNGQAVDIYNSSTNLTNELIIERRVERKLPTIKATRQTNYLYNKDTTFEYTKTSVGEDSEQGFKGVLVLYNDEVKATFYETRYYTEIKKVTTLEVKTGTDPQGKAIISSNSNEEVFERVLTKKVYRCVFEKNCYSNTISEGVYQQ